ncbi:MAG: peptide chain release factor N(5)-glutamine methyltransferase [Desulfovibrionaceae bacterium]|nr:peptide chain release factor N(5)-glutamine methyltransferase [Desulfovibrionaceae bacterium]
MRIRDWLRYAAARLAQRGRDSPHLTAECILAHALRARRIDIILHPDERVSSETQKELARFLALRLEGLPLAYITGEKEFYGIPLQVTVDTLIPRPDTECLVEQVIADHKGKNPLFADLGTGSGAIGIALAANIEGATGLLIDKSERALACAKRNILRSNLTERLICLAGTFAELPIKERSLDIVVANPPYIAIGEYVMDEVVRFEPHTALFAENEGLAAIYQVIDQAARLLKSGGALYIEHGATQGEKVRAYMAQKFFSVKTKKDLAGRERMSYCLFR